MAKRCEPTCREGKAGTKKPRARRRLSAADRQRRKAKADRRYYERCRSGCGVTAYLESPEVKKALIRRLQPLGLTVSQAINTLLTAVAEGRLTLHPTPDPLAFDPGDMDDEFRELEVRSDLNNFATRWDEGRR